ncbi:zinc transporter 3 [Puma concolor]|uniref:Probable proton-coupled zinc antiporter SLC30A3 n=1 Tax=Puma concolor TaxID=9696 RepID=A0A6P6I5B5_PUMCO|nr:zinc transporter 3 [Puma concolor]
MKTQAKGVAAGADQTGTREQGPRGWEAAKATGSEGNALVPRALWLCVDSVPGLALYFYLRVALLGWGGLAQPPSGCETSHRRIQWTTALVRRANRLGRFLTPPENLEGGYLAHSLAIMTDAAHLLADVGSMMGSLFSLWLSTRPATRTMTFGWHRSETLGALASVVSLWMVTGILLYLAFIRLLHSDYHIEGGAMLLTASIAVCANLLMAFVLHQAGPPHSHGSRGAEYAPLEEGPGEPLPLGNTSVRAAFVHVLGDLLQSLGVLAASVLIYFKPQYKAADPISTFLFSICALGSTAPTLRDVLRVLMEGSPRSVGFEPVRDTLLSVPGVRATHELHLWSLTLTYHVASAHLAIDSTADPEAVLAEATSQLHSRFGFSSCTLQVEQYQPEMAQCLRCREPPQA